MEPGIDPRAVASASRLRDDLLKVADREVVDDNIERDSITAIARTLAACDPKPAAGVEASVVTRSAAKIPRAPWPFLVHVTNHPDDSKVVDGVDCEGDPDLVLHYAVLCRHGWTAVGTPAADGDGEIDRATIVAHLAAELRWSAGNASESYAVLNACRALRFVSDGTLCSKTDGGKWALSGQIEPDLVEDALTARRVGLSGSRSAASRAWVLSIASLLEQAQQ